MSAEKPAEPGGRYLSTVPAADRAGHRRPEPPSAPLDTTLPGGGPWGANWISMGRMERDEDGRGKVSYLRRLVTLAETPRRAVAYVTALGIYRLYVNGERVSDVELAPGWTDYAARIEYQVYELTGRLRRGRNTVEIVVAPGWWAGHVAWFGQELYGSQPAASAQIQLTYDGRRTEMLVTEETGWEGRHGRVVATDLLMGETQDLAGYSPDAGVGLDDAPDVWRPVVEVPRPEAALHAQRSEPVRIVMEVPVLTCMRMANDIHLLDFGQNLTGRVRLVANGRRGTRVVIRHGEALDAQGRLYTANLRTATQSNVFVLAGGDDEVLEPEFTLQGFRYAEVRGDIAPLRRHDASGLVLTSDLQPTGEFRTSDPLLTRIQQNVVWTQRGTFVSVPVDCSQRDERLGWAGDIHLFADAAAFNADCSRFLGSWLTSLADGQAADGAVPDIAPYVRTDPPARDIQYGQPGWGDAIVGVPWTLYAHFGDRRILEEHWGPMRRWIDYLCRSGRLIRPGGVYGDWNFVGPETPSALIGTYWFARSAALMVRIARVLGDESAAREYAQLRAAIGAAFADEFLREDGTLRDPTQTGYVLALDADLVPGELVAAAAGALVADLKGREWRLTTGFVGTAALLPVLTRHGFTDAAYRIATSTAYPSWGFQVANDATTIWEHWDSWHPGRGFQNARMNSLNHFAFAAVGSWLYRWVAGIRPDPEDAGYRTVVLAPHPHPSVRTVTARYDSVRGSITSAWFHDDENLRLSFTIPPGAQARFSVPWLSSPQSILSIEGTSEVEVSASESGRVSMALGPGSALLIVPASLMPNERGASGDADRD